MRRKLVVGNWKMNGDLASNAALLKAVRDGWTQAAQRDLAVCVPFPYLGQVRDELSASAIGWGAQNASKHASGAYTGEVSTGMLRDFGCRYAIVGHSERRALYAEADATVAAKAARVVQDGLTPIVCVGETLGEREASATEAVVLRQLDAVIEALGSRMADVVVAYEPVWAIGTGKTASTEQAQAVHAFIRGRLAGISPACADVRVLYGGSVNGDNAASLFAMPDVDGGLVGGASLKSGEFLTIAHA